MKIAPAPSTTRSHRQSTTAGTVSNGSVSNASRMVVFSNTNEGSRNRTGRENTEAHHSARRDFLSYCLSLMRSHNAEHLDSLPILDVSSLKHVAYVFDALIYYMRAGADQCDPELIKDPSNTYWTTDLEDNDNDDAEEEIVVPMETDAVDDQDSAFSTINSGLYLNNKGRKHPFFQRSDSTLNLGCTPPDPFETPLTEALPLAEQPQLLQPNCRREDLFGAPKQAFMLNSSTLNPSEVCPSRLGVSTRITDILPTAAKAFTISAPTIYSSNPTSEEYSRTNLDQSGPSTSKINETPLTYKKFLNVFDHHTQETPEDLSCSKSNYGSSDDNSESTVMKNSTSNVPVTSQISSLASSISTTVASTSVPVAIPITTTNSEEEMSMVRPQVIVSVQKSKTSNASQNFSTAGSSIRSPAKSVIVHASSVSFHILQQVFNRSS